MTDAERKEFGRLSTDEARSAFVERFWQRLDPDPATARNEFRETYEARSAEVEKRFESIGGPPWSSDRGRVYLLLGEPRGVRRETAGLLAVEKEVWVYPTGDTPQGIEIPFFRCPDGGYRLDPACPPASLSSASSEWFRANASRWAAFGTPALTQTQVDDVLDSIAGTHEPESKRPRPPAEQDAAAPSESTPVPFADAAYFFRAQDGSVLTMLGIELDERPASASEGGVQAAVTLQERTGGVVRSVLLERTPSHEGTWVFLARSYLTPGSTLAARYAVKDEAREEILVRHRRLDVPDLSGFSASSVVPAERFGPAGGDERLVVGSEEVLPRPGGVFRPGELLRLYLQVYGAETDPRTSMPRVDVAFRFTCDAKTRPKAIREPLKVTGASGASMGLALPIGDWPAGRYRVDVDLHDRVSGRRAAVSGAFRIVAR